VQENGQYEYIGSDSRWYVVKLANRFLSLLAVSCCVEIPACKGFSGFLRALANRKDFNHIITIKLVQCKPGAH